MDEESMKKRTKIFALRIIKLVESLSNNIIGRAIGGQLVRAGTSVGANYRFSLQRAFKGRIYR